MPMPPFQGSITALITPFKNGEVETRAYQRHVEWQIDQGTHGLVPVGTTGESPTLSHEEHKRVIALCIEAAAGRVPVIAGTGSNCTSEAVALTRYAKGAGADGEDDQLGTRWTQHAPAHPSAEPEGQKERTWPRSALRATSSTPQAREISGAEVAGDPELEPRPVVGVDRHAGRARDLRDLFR